MACCMLRIISWPPREVHELWMTEVCCLRKLSHPNVVDCYGLLHAPDYLLASFEFAGRDTLWTAIRRCKGGLPPPKLQDYFAQIATAVAHCHVRRVAHGDLKPENIGVSASGRLQLLDFGHAMRISSGHGQYSGIHGTVPFMAPEVVLQGPHSPTASDIWALGVILMEMVCGANKMPKVFKWKAWPAANLEHAEELVSFFMQTSSVKASVEEDYGSPVPKVLSELLTGTLAVDPVSRLTAGKVKEKAHTWLVSTRAKLCQSSMTRTTARTTDLHGHSTD
eukprot:gnl/TRDRNA2_/TRDRNA2_149367_c0_seq1.p1 gnl/TRDRNA2_/TRDRNA2_149367_c0~~gnl/TRDRNA2_/TRDRNA2_149367_c0_seq1.p1  ORF type:complete len:279 (-),score=40.27 gnl/TRDRNA2_/TRDRNA2_149367_c0_seq1:77-913(-)